MKTSDGRMTGKRRSAISKSLGRMFDRLLDLSQEAEESGDKDLADMLSEAKAAVCSAWSMTGGKA